MSSRIRLMPHPFSEQRLVQLFSVADVAIDSFPLGGSFSMHALALSCGLPIVTLENGIKLSTPVADLQDMRTTFQQYRSYYRNPMYQQLIRQDVPWLTTQSVLTDFYKKNKLSDKLVANNTAEFVQLVQELVEDKEESYQLRVRLMEAMDEKKLGASAAENDDGSLDDLQR